MPTFMRPLLRPHRTLLSLSFSALTASMSTTSTPPPSSSSSSDPTNTTPTPSPPTWPTHPYHPRHTAWPYQPSDFTRADPTPDGDFYSAPRYVTHIDEHAISLLKAYYASTLPRHGRLLDFCSSWISHFPPALHEAATTTTRPSPSSSRDRHDADDTRTPEVEQEQEPRQTQDNNRGIPDLEVTGLGLSAPELAANPVLRRRITHDLNALPSLPASVPDRLDAATCVVSIDYLTSPLEVLASLRRKMRPGGVVHLVVSNRCFPTKVVARWLRVDEEERLQMVGDYLWWSGWRRVEVVVLSDGTSGDAGAGADGGRRGWFGFGLGLGFGVGRVDPLWVVRGVNVGDGLEGMGEGGRGQVRDEL